MCYWNTMSDPIKRKFHPKATTRLFERSFISNGDNSSKVSLRKVHYARMIRSTKQSDTQDETAWTKTDNLSPSQERIMTKKNERLFCSQRDWRRRCTLLSAFTPSSEFEMMNGKIAYKLLHKNVDEKKGRWRLAIKRRTILMNRRKEINALDSSFECLSIILQAYATFLFLHQRHQMLFSMPPKMMIIIIMKVCKGEATPSRLHDKSIPSVDWISLWRETIPA